MNPELFTSNIVTNLSVFEEFYRKNNAYNDNFKSWSIKKQDALVLANIVRCVKPLTSLVIGLYKGLSSLIILDEIKQNQNNILYGIDPFFENYIAGNNYHSDYKKAIDHFDKNRQIVTLRGFATIPGPEAHNLTKTNESKNKSLWNKIDEIPSNLDFCFIDGDHDFEIAKKDFFSCLKKLNAGGVIALHDIYDPLWQHHLQKLEDIINNLKRVSYFPIQTGANGMGIIIKKD